jgi:hypothetical protein
MKLITTAAAVLLLGANGLHAQTSPAGAASERAGDGRTLKMSAEVVSIDATAKTITVRNLSTASEKDRPSTTAGEAATSVMTTRQATLSLEGKAVERLGSLKAGDKVTLTCKAAPTPALPPPPPPGAQSANPNPGMTPKPSPNPTPGADPTAARSDPTSAAAPVATDPAASPAAPSKETMGARMPVDQPCRSVIEIGKTGS